MEENVELPTVGVLFVTTGGLERLLESRDFVDF